MTDSQDRLIAVDTPATKGTIPVFRGPMEVGGMSPGPEGTVPVRDDSAVFGYRWETGPGKALTDAKEYTDQQVAGLDLGSGIETVSGTVTLDASGEPIREFYTTGATTFYANGTTTPVGAHTAVVWRRTSQGSWGYQVVPEEWTTPTPTPDTQAPTAGTLTVTVTDVAADLSVSGATDDRGVTGYAFQVNGGAWSSWQTGPTYTATGLTPSTSYTFRHKVRDAAGNETQGTAVSKTTAEEILMTYTEAVLMDAPLHFLPLDDATGAQSARNLGSAGTAWPIGAGVTMEGWSMGALTRAAHMTAKEAAITAPTSTMMSGETAWTAEAIIHRGSSNSRQAVVSSARTAWGIVLNDHSVYGYHNGTFTSASTAGAAVGPSLETATPVHVAFTYDGTTLTGYKNGVKEDQKAVTGPVADETVRPAIGKAGDPSILGYIAGVALYKGKALTADRILAHAKSAGLA